ncbi:MAG: hypothetical protein IPM91_02280 [Bacteroidetes bacterium]|nr:hypothetical protein [Bacteroidota bacterium]
MKRVPIGSELTYKAQIQTKDIIIRCRVVVEWDTCSLVLPDVKNSPGNWGW